MIHERAGRLTEVSDDLPEWVEPLCRIAAEWRESGRSILQNFRLAAPVLSDLPRLRGCVETYLVEHAELVAAWQSYSYDKRSSPSPYLDDKKVGFYDRGYRDVRQYHDRTRACADFICREAAWVLEGRRVSFPSQGGVLEA
ncbi:MAG: hypothetical protein ACREN2_08170 [Candidatus Dormibacteria bacterium]